jgi:hypothetical protein
MPSPQHEFTDAAIVPEKLTRGQKAVLHAAGTPEGMVEAAHDGADHRRAGPPRRGGEAHCQRP